MTKKKIILTFDYEMYLGEDSGTIEKCMLEPTNKILNVLKQYNGKGLFFVDATFLTVLKKDYIDGYLKVKKQILDMLKFGNDIGLHIHPHWLDSYMISENRWSFKSYDKFRIHSLSEEAKSKIIYDSFNELDSIVKEFSTEYRIDSFRAGGWCIQPFAFIKDDLKSIGIKYDFSVLPGLKKNNLPRHYYNYITIPENNFWKFNDNILEEVEDGEFIEIPTTIIKINIFDVYRIKRYRKHFKKIGDGKGADNSSNTLVNKIKKIKIFIKYTLSSDFIPLNLLKKNINKLDNLLLVYVAHPKNFTNESFKVLEYLAVEYDLISYKKIK